MSRFAQASGFQRKPGLWGAKPGLLAFVLVLSAALHAQQSPPRPEFRAGTDIVTLDVVVLDRDRKPVRGLTAADFVVTEARDRQEVVSFTEVTVPPPDMTAAPWTRDIGADVVSNDVAGRRLVAILLDDANGSRAVEDHALTLTKRTAHAIVDQLGPGDLGAVVYTFLGRFENFTDDKQRLHKAVEDYVPRNDKGSLGAGIPLGCVLRAPGASLGGGGCQVNSLTRMAEVLKTAPPGRKMVAFISPGIKIPQNVMQNPDSMSGLPFIKTMFQMLQEANATVYQFDPRGLTTQVDNAAEVSIASATGGRNIRNTNAPERIVPAVFEENSAYYLLGYRSTHTRTDGLFRRVNVIVRRPDVQVTTRNGYFGPTKPKKPSKAPPPAPVEAALAGGILATDLRLGVNVAVFAVPGRKQAEVTATIAITEPSHGDALAPLTHAVELMSAAYDTGWRTAIEHRQTLELAHNPAADGAAKYEVTSRMSLKPGRYELRFAADADDRTGSVYLSIDVPNFADEALSLSGLLIENPGDTRAPSGDSLADLVPIVPTANRTFKQPQRPIAFMRIYEGGSKPPTAVEMTAEVKDRTDRTVSTQTGVVAPVDFTAARSADYRVALPVGGLAPGEYLLTVVARCDDKRLERAVRFHVE